MLLANGRFWVKVDQLAAAEMITPKEKGTGIIKLIFNTGAILPIDCGSTQREDFNRLWRAMDKTKKAEDVEFGTKP